MFRSLGEMACPAGESYRHTSTFGTTQTASVAFPGQTNGFRSKMNESS